MVAVAWGVWVVASVRRRVAVVGCPGRSTRIAPGPCPGLSPNPPRPPHQIGSYTQSICG
jgi:hypothetical protein